MAKIRVEVKLISKLDVPDVVLKHTDGGLEGYKEEVKKAMQTHMMEKFGPTVVITVLDDQEE